MPYIQNNRNKFTMTPDTQKTLPDLHRTEKTLMSSTGTGGGWSSLFAGQLTAVAYDSNQLARGRHRQSALAAAIEAMRRMVLAAMGDHPPRASSTERGTNEMPTSSHAERCLVNFRSSDTSRA